VGVLTNPVVPAAAKRAARVTLLAAGAARSEAGEPRAVARERLNGLLGTVCNPGVREETRQAARAEIVAAVADA